MIGYTGLNEQADKRGLTVDVISRELMKMGITCDSCSVLQDKDGVTVSRIESAGVSYVLKCFRSEAFQREILNYRILSSLNIPTIKVVAATDSALLLEDIDRSPVYRLGGPEDMADPEVARRIAVWYKQLHKLGYDYVALHGADLYDEADCFTLPNIAFIKEKTHTSSAPAWALLEQNFDAISTILHNAGRTLTYNDFYYTNMVVARDKSSALMLDYNLLGRGYAYADLRNVTSSLSEEAGRAFQEDYGDFDPMEKALDDVVSVVVTLYLACRREEFPRWALELLDELKTTFADKIENLCKNVPTK